MITPNIKGAGAVGSFYVTLTGTEGETDEILLSSKGFVEGTTAVLDEQAKSIGDI